MTLAAAWIKVGGLELTSCAIGGFLRDIWKHAEMITGITHQFHGPGSQHRVGHGYTSLSIIDLYINKIYYIQSLTHSL